MADRQSFSGESVFGSHVSSDYSFPCSSNSVGWGTLGSCGDDFYDATGFDGSLLDSYFGSFPGGKSSLCLLDGLPRDGVNMVVDVDQSDPMFADGCDEDSLVPIRYNGDFSVAVMPPDLSKKCSDSLPLLHGSDSHRSSVTSSANRFAKSSLTLSVSSVNLEEAWKVSRLFKWASMLVADHRCFSVSSVDVFKLLRAWGVSCLECRWVVQFLMLGFANYSGRLSSQPVCRNFASSWRSGKRWKFRQFRIDFSGDGRSAIVSVFNSTCAKRFACRRFSDSWISSCPTGPLIGFRNKKVHILDSAPLCGHIGWKDFRKCKVCCPNPSPPVVFEEDEIDYGFSNVD